MEAFKEKTIGFLLVGGACLSVISFLLMFAFAGGSVFHATATRNPITNEITDMGDGVYVAPALLGFTAGIAMILGGLVYGLIKHRNRYEGIMRTIPNVRVIARYGYTKDWNMLTEEYQFAEADDPTYYLKLETSPGVVNEFECRPETYFMAGEGMTGEAVLKGKWCGRFAPYIGVRPEVAEVAGRY
jgi:hypothetical protein